MDYLAVNNKNELEIASIPTPIIEPTQCLIKISAVGVNRADILQKAGKYPAPPGESEILGLEVCGEIVEVGQTVSNWRLGDKVFGLVAGGGYAQYVAVNSEHLMKLPSSFTAIQGAGIAEVFLTAYQSLFSIAKLVKGESVLIHAGASGVGTAAIQLAKAKGANVTVTVGSEQKVSACLSLGADHAINYHDIDFVSWAKDHRRKFDVIVDVVAGNYLSKNLKVSALDARIVILSMLGGRYAEQVDIAKMLQMRVNVHASTLRNRSNEYKSQLVRGFISEFGEYLNKATIKPVIAESFHWHQAELAHQKMVNNENTGKYILTLD